MALPKSGRRFHHARTVPAGAAAARGHARARGRRRGRRARGRLGGERSRGLELVDDGLDLDGALDDDRLDDDEHDHDHHHDLDRVDDERLGWREQRERRERRRGQVQVLRDRYRVRVELRRHRLSVWRSERLVMRQPVGVGRPGTPTPVGRYYLVELIQTDDPQGPYGPYAFGLSAHSDVLQRFDGGDGQVGIHGTNFLQGLGTDVSHGCIRIGNGAIVRLARTLPLGTPVTIVGGARPAQPPHARPPVARPISAAPTPSPGARAAPPQPRPTAGWAVAFRRYVEELLAFLHLE